MKIQTLEEFRNIISKDKGFIAITDIANPTKIHSTNCQRLKEDYFFEKMVENDGKYGLYLWYATDMAAHDDHPKAANCRFCNA